MQGGLRKNWWAVLMPGGLAELADDVELDDVAVLVDHESEALALTELGVEHEVSEDRALVRIKHGEDDRVRYHRMVGNEDVGVLMKAPSDTSDRGSGLLAKPQHQVVLSEVRPKRSVPEPVEHFIHQVSVGRAGRIVDELR